MQRFLTKIIVRFARGRFDMHEGKARRPSRRGFLGAAADAILDRVGSNAPRVPIGTLWAAPVCDPAKQIDEQRHRAGQPNLLDVVPPSVPA